MPIDLSPTSTRALPVSPILTSLRSLPFPWYVCANEAPGVSLFHSSVSRPHGGRQRPSLLAMCIQADTPIPAVGKPSPTAAVRPLDIYLQVQFPDEGTEQPSTCLSPRPVLHVAAALRAPNPPAPLGSVVYVGGGGVAHEWVEWSGDGAAHVQCKWGRGWSWTRSLR